MVWSPCLIHYRGDAGVESLRLGDPLIDDYLAFVKARARRNTWLAAAYDLKVFLAVVPKSPGQVITADVLAFVRAQREPRHGPQ